MSEEVALAIADENNRRRVAELDRLRRWAGLWRACAKMLRGRLQHQTKQRIYWRTRYREVLEARDAALADNAAMRAAIQAWHAALIEVGWPAERMGPLTMAIIAAASIPHPGAELPTELAACQHAARMPADYKHGLPAWINKLYLCYVAAQDSPAQDERIEREVARAETDLRTQLVDAQTALRAAMEQAEATQRELMRLRGDDGHGKPYLNEM